VRVGVERAGDLAVVGECAGAGQTRTPVLFARANRDRLGSSPIPLPKPSLIAPDPAVSARRRKGCHLAYTPENQPYSGSAVSLCKQEVTGSIPVGSTI